MRNKASEGEDNYPQSGSGNWGPGVNENQVCSEKADNGADRKQAGEKNVNEKQDGGEGLDDRRRVGCGKDWGEKQRGKKGKVVGRSRSGM